MARAGEEIRNPAAGLTLRLIKTAADTNAELLEMEATYEPSSVEPVEHFHPSQNEHFEILEGTLEAEIDGERRRLRAGDTLDIPAGMRHSMWNASDGQARSRWQTRPAMRTEQFFESLARLMGEGKPNPLRLGVLANAYRDEFRATKPRAAVQTVLLPLASAVGRLLGYRA